LYTFSGSHVRIATVQAQVTDEANSIEQVNGRTINVNSAKVATTEHTYTVRIGDGTSSILVKTAA